jgi:hypothetical protein
VAEIIRRGEPACLLSHWTGIWWNGQERGFKVMQEVVRRLDQHRDEVVWMKLGEIARYWAARELTRIRPTGPGIELNAPFAAPAFTLRVDTGTAAPKPVLLSTTERRPLSEVSARGQLAAGTWFRDRGGAVCCFDLPRGRSTLELQAA